MIEVDSKINLFTQFNTDCYFEIMFMATLPEYERRSIGKSLCQYSIELANELRTGTGHSIDFLPQKIQDKRPKIITANMSSDYSQKIAKSLGFITLAEFLYTNRIFRGKTYATRINNPLHQSTTLVAKKLSDH